MCEVQPPEIFVRVPVYRRSGMGLDSAGRVWSTHKYMAAKIRVRRGCYRYLVWRDGLFKREFYLGKVKNLALQIPRAARTRSAAAGGPAGDIAGVQS